jgi:O-acetyl-ADP-ribose deacetylase (regulator of RNase III)
MSVDFVKGSVLDADVQYICHQVNCQGKMNSGVAKAIREKWPGVFTAYQNYCNYHIPRGGTKSMLGTCQYLDVEVSKKTVINMFAQDTYGYDGRRYTSYDAFWACLGDITKVVPKGSTIAFPDHIGCCRGGANWEIIKIMIITVLSNDYKVYIYKWEED